MSNEENLDISNKFLSTMAKDKAKIFEIWSGLSPGLEAIYRRQDKMAPNRYMELYTLVFNYCTNTHSELNALHASKLRGKSMAAVGAEFVGEDLYNKLRDFIKTYTTELLQNCRELHSEQLLDYYNQIWTKFQFSSTVVNGIFSYLNRHWIKRNIDESVKHDILEVYNLAVSIWKEVLFDQLHHNITAAALALIEQDRNGEMITTKLINGVVNSYVELGINEKETEDNGQQNATAENPVTPPRPTSKYKVYRNHFENRFIDETRNFYTKESSHFLQTYSVQEYMKKVEERLNEERDRCQIYLDSSTLDPLLKACDDALITQHLEQIHNEFEPLLGRQQNEHLGRMFDLCQRVEGALTKIKEILGSYIEREGQANIQQIARDAINDPKQYIACILRMYEQYNKMVVESFKMDHGFVESMDKAFGKFINDNEITRLAKTASKSPQLLVMYCDQLLRKSARNVEDEKMDEYLEQVMTIFKYIEDKDVFQAFYHKMLCKRLVTDSSASEEAERQMIAKLKHMCGFEYTTKLERLLTDVALSRDNSDQFRQQKKPANVDFSVIVVMSNVWPLSQPVKFEVPTPIELCMNEFQSYYTTKFNGRKLNWVLQMCRGELVSTPNTFAMKYTFICNTQQMAVLMHFNSRDEYQLDELLAMVSAQREQLLPILQSLVKSELLKSDSTAGRASSIDQDLSGTTLFRFNPSFANKKLKVDLCRTMATTKEARKEGDDVQKSVDEDRKIVIQACIVRIMKMRKSLKHQQLVGEVLNQLTARFQPKVPMVKKCIDSLIEKEYLKRAEDDRDTYEYLA